MIGTQEIIFIVIAIILIFGAKRIPDIARSIGSGIKEFKKALSSTEDDAVYKLKEKNIKQQYAKKRKSSSK